MRVGLRRKVVALLTAVALLPLLAAMLTIVLHVRALRIASFGQRLSSVVASEARMMQMSLSCDVDKLHLVLNESAVLAEAASLTELLPAAEREKLDAEWPRLADSHPAVRKVLDNRLADLLNLIRRDDPRIAELLVADRYGQLVAATGRTSDFYQADEQWWQEAYAGGTGRIFIEEVNYDRSSRVWSLDLCIPLAEEGRAIGIAKAVLELSQWIGSPIRDVGQFPASVMLVTGDGRIVFGPGIRQPFEGTAAIWTEAAPGDETRRWRENRSGQILARADIHVPDQLGPHKVKSPTWGLILYMPKSAPLRAVNRLAMITLGVGLAIIGVIFVGGLLLVERSIVRRVRRLADATRKVAAGDLTYRIRTDRRARRLLGRDEIDNLADDFDRMVDRIQQSHELLEAANDLKAKFIQIASHELRTPVGYILGMAGLLGECEDLPKLRSALGTISDKARRLSEIIGAMFKLLPQQTYGEYLHYATVSIPRLLEEVRTICRPFLERRKQRLVIESADRVPDVQADEGKLRDVVENLVMNAIKFTPDGGVIRLRSGPEIGGYVRIAVEDQGPGIPRGDLPHIFEPFFSGGDVLQHSSGRAGYGKRGMGLGLTIVRHFVRLHGGTVSVSAGQTGSVFTVTIPIEPPPRAGRPEHPED